MKNFSYILFLLFAMQSLTAQSEIRGLILDDSGSPLIGASIIVAGISKGTVSDYDGSFQISVKAGIYDIEISYTGFQSFIKKGIKTEVGKTTDIGQVILNEDSTTLSEVVVSARGSRTTKSVSASVQSVPNRSTRRRSKKARTTKPKANIYSDSAYPQQSNSKRKVQQETSPAAGQLTAGHWRDIDNKDYWKDMLSEDLNSWKTHWQMYPDEVIETELKNAAGLPLIDAEVRLYANNELIWTSRTDNHGKACLWVNPFSEEKEKSKLRAEVVHKGKVFPINIKQKEGKQSAPIKVKIPCVVNPVIDLLFAIDLSGSMRDELSFLKSELKNVIDRAEKINDGKVIRTASVCYQSPGDEYVTKVSDFTTDKSCTSGFFVMQEAKGGKGGTEAVELGLEQALRMSWSENALARILFLLLDEAPAHDSERLKKLQNLSREAAERGIKIVPIVGSGAKRDLEFLMRALSVMTNGTYVFLTDHSGIGGSHLEPAVDSYEVFALNDLLVKIIKKATSFKECTLTEKAKSDVSKTEREEFNFRVFPNPVNEVLNFERGEGISASLYNYQGQFLQEIPEGEGRIDMSIYPAGSYFLEVRKEKQVKSVQINVVR